mgnify:CR=1 FL=1
MSTVFDDSNTLNQLYEKRGLIKGVVIDVLSDFVLSYNFIDILKRFLCENVIRRDTLGIIYSGEYEIDEEGYFGENKVLFYFHYGLDETKEDIVTYEELCDYLEVACEFFINKHADKKAEVIKLLELLREKYKLNDSFS